MKKNKSDALNTESFEKFLELITAYQRSRILYTLVELEIPDILSRKKTTFSGMAKRKEIHPLVMERFLNAAVSIGLLKREKNYYLNTEMTENFLVKGKEFYLGGEIERHRGRSFPVWAKLTEKLKKWKYGNDKKPDSTAQEKEEDQGAEAMKEQHNLALLQGFSLAEAYDFSKFKRILDLGGGSGATSIALCRTYPNLKSLIFDRPENTKIADHFVGQNKLTARIKTISGDFKKDDLPDDFDVVLLANLMSVADAGENQKLLKKLYKKLPRRGVCMLSGWIIDDSKLSPEISVLFCLEDICWEAPDVERSEKLYTKWLKAAGFIDIKCRTYLEPTKMLYGSKK